MLLNSHGVEYLLIGGYAVGYYGYPRATADMDVWIAVAPDNAPRVYKALKAFGMDVPELTPDLFLQENKVIRMGIPPLRIEIITTVSGVSFAECYARREVAQIEDVSVNLINRQDLKRNKKASGRHKDLDDLEHLA